MYLSYDMVFRCPHGESQSLLIICRADKMWTSARTIDKGDDNMEGRKTKAIIHFDNSAANQA